MRLQFSLEVASQMTTYPELTVLLCGLLGAGVAKALSKLSERDRKLQREGHRRMLVRLDECTAVVQAAAEHFGEPLKQILSRQELESWIQSGLTPEGLAKRILDRSQEIAGLYLGDCCTESIQLPVMLPHSLRSRHLYVVGKSGSGKTTMLANVMRQDLESGQGFAVLAPEQELLTEELFPFIPEHRLDDVIYVNPKDTRRPVVLNPLTTEPWEDIDLKVDEVTSILHRVFADEGSTSAPRMETLLRHGIYALVQIPGATLLDFPRLLDRADPEGRNQLLIRGCPNNCVTGYDVYYLERRTSWPRDGRRIRLTSCSPT